MMALRSFEKDTSHFLGIDMGGTNIRAAIVDGTGRVIHTENRALGSSQKVKAEAPLLLAEEYADRVAGIGLAVAGTVDDGVLTWSANLNLHGVEYRREINRRTGLPSVVLNDARAAGLAEARVGAGAGAATVLAITVGTGIGGAVIVNGNLLEGTGDAGEIGHMVLDPGGAECTCGRHGCWELMVSGKALARRAKQLYPGAPDPLGVLIIEASNGTAVAREAVESITQDFAMGVDNLSAILAPQVIVLGGGVMARNGLIAERYRSIGPRLRWGRRARIVDSALGDTAGQIGAALAAAEVTKAFAD